MPAVKADVLLTDPLGLLYSRPGFLFRRAHQIAVGIFIEECAELELTPPQHSVLIAIAHYPRVSQADVSRLLGFDRATVGQVVKGLAGRDLVRRLDSAQDKRNKVIELTPKGARLLRRASAAMARISSRMLSPLNPPQRKMLLELLGRVIDELNPASRTPLKPFTAPDSGRRAATLSGDLLRIPLATRRRRQNSGG